MRLLVEASEGDLAANPEDALLALADAAEADGADRDDWIEKAIRSGGARSKTVPVDATPRYRAVEETVARAMAVYDRAMKLAKLALQARLERAAREVDVRRYERYAEGHDTTKPRIVG